MANPLIRYPHITYHGGERIVPFGWWEIRYLLTGRWFGELEGLIDFHTYTRAEAQEWVIRNGLACFIVGSTNTDPPETRYFHLRFGRWSLNWRRRAVHLH